MINRVGAENFSPLLINVFGMISKKGKRKIVFEGLTYYWYVKKENDTDFLSISSEDKKLVLSYRVNQIDDDYLRPKIRVVQSEKLLSGVYLFWPILSDEAISNYNVFAILNWYMKKTAESAKDGLITENIH